ncbi:aspartyl/asparaginyl beta-hydroxylase domain-containing protein [Pedobacter sp. GSP4]|uniref:aspartyl/asparaginyl beta-hydroxylase domain-containing protein n=1 Tax=Pedobacter sp. GSP4 TaxID=3453716 RepID=UPI003F6F854F
MQHELLAVTQNWKAHFNTYHYSGDWTVFPLRTPDGTDSIFAELAGASCFLDHPNMKLFPSIKQFTDGLPCEIMSVRLLNLAAGSVIKEHRDVELAFEKGEARLHIPLKTSNQVEFYVNSERVVMAEGECWYINANLPHRVTNNSTSDRIHLVIDCKVNAWLQDVILTSNIIAHAPDEMRDPELLKQMIVSLRSQNTTAASQLADSLQQEYDNLIPS